MKGHRQKLDFVSFIDAKSKKKVTRLTPLDYTCHRNYFYQKCFSKSGNNLLFAGDFDGNLNYHMLNLETQIATHLTVGSGDNTFGGFVSHDDKFLYYVKNNSSLRRLDIQTYEENIIYESPHDWVSYGTWVANSSTTKIVGIEIHKNSWKPLKSWQEFIDMYHSKPLCRLFSVDLISGKQNIIYEDTKWLGHPLYKPFDDNTVAFCHEGPHDLITSRMWFVNEDGSNIRQGKSQEKDEHCTHEFFVPDGSKMIYVSFKDNISKRYICSVDSNTLKNEIIMEMPNCSHLMSNFDGSLLVGDGTSTPPDVVDSSKHKIDNDENLYLFNTITKKVEVIGEHKTSWQVINGNRQLSHPHPSFCPRSERVLWGSDFEGIPAIYLTHLKDD